VVAQEAEARRYRGLIKYWPAVCAGATQRRVFVGIFLKAVGVALVVMLVVRLDGQARELRGPTGSLPQRKMLGCYVKYHMLYVGSSYFVPNGTLITFVAKLENAGLYRQRLHLPSDIPPHLFINVSVYYPLLPVFQNGNCEAWFIRRPVVAPGR
jgi:hypothetical protein